MIQRRILTIVLVGLTGFVFAAPAGAAKSPHRYTPKHGAKCHKAYKRVVKHKRHHRRKVFCVKRAARAKKTAKAKAPTSQPDTAATTSSTAEKPSLHSHLDPTFTRDPLNPFKVTYAYSASASQDASPQARTLGMVEEPAPLPSGVLSLFSDGKLECAINVGGGVEGSECPVFYQALGSHSVTTIYASGEQSATETETETIEPLATTTTLASSYAGDPGGPHLIKAGRQCTYGWGASPGHPGEEEDCVYTYEWMLGSLTVEGGSTPAGAIQLHCLSAWCPPSLDGRMLGSVVVPVVLKAKANARAKSLPAAPSCEWIKEHATQGGQSVFEDWSYPTGLLITGSPTAPGYQASSAQSLTEWSPLLPC